MTEKEPAKRIDDPKAGNYWGSIFSRLLIPDSMPQHFRVVPLAIGFHYTKHDSLKWLRVSPLDTQIQFTRARNQPQKMTSIIFTLFSYREFAPFYALIISTCPGSSSCQPALSAHGGKVTFFLLNVDPAKIVPTFSPDGGIIVKYSTRDGVVTVFRGCSCTVPLWHFSSGALLPALTISL